MRHFFTRFQTALLTFLLIVLAVTSGTAQTQSAMTVISALNTSNAQLAVDNSANTAAVLSVPLLGGISRLRSRFASTVRAGGRAGVIIKVDSGLDLAAFNNIVIRTYVEANSTAEETIALSSLVSLSVVSSAKTTVEFRVGRDFNQIELQASGLVNASSSVDLFMEFGTLSPLPVELVAFEGKTTQAGAVLTWNTASERNNDYFAVERAIGSPENFRAIAQVQGAGSSTQPQRYQYVDAGLAGVSYYRLRQVDRDGQESFSPVVVLRAAKADVQLAAYPNPATESVVVTGVAGTQVGVFNSVGKQLQLVEIPLAQKQVVDLHAVPNGVYYLRNLTAGTTVKFVKAGQQ